MNYKDILLQNDYLKNLNLDYALDPLTSVLNREAIIKYLKYLLDSEKTFTLMLIDIDNFKHINDSYGHMTGDLVLSRTAQIFMETTYNNGVVGRYGGDEFIIILENIYGYNEIWEIAHKLCINASSILFKEANNSNITITCGVSRCPTDGNTYDEIITKADKALYRGKTKGRNCFIIYLAYKHDKLQLLKTSDPCSSTLNVNMNIFNYLEKIYFKQGLEDTLKYLLSTFMFDHICIQDKGKLYFEITHELSRNKDFSYIPTKLIGQIINKDVAYVTSLDNLELIEKKELKDLLDEQKISATCFAKIDAYGICYGYLRVDMTSIRMWQDNELNVIATCAKIIGLILYNKNLNIEDVLNSEKLPEKK